MNRLTSSGADRPSLSAACSSLCSMSGGRSMVSDMIHLGFPLFPGFSGFTAVRAHQSQGIRCWHDTIDFLNRARKPFYMSEQTTYQRTRRIDCAAAALHIAESAHL